MMKPQRRDLIGFRAGIPARNCGNCSQFFYLRQDCKLGRCGRCHVVKGCIYAHDLCDLWEAVVNDGALIGAYAAAAVAIIGAVFNGLALLKHTSNPDAHQAPTLEGKP